MCAAVERAFAAAWKAAGLDPGPPPPAGKGGAAAPDPAGPRVSGAAAAGEPGDREEEERKRGSGKGVDVARADRRRAEDLRVRVLQGQAHGAAQAAAVQERAPAAAATGGLERELAERRAAERRIAQQWVALQARRAQAAEAAAAAQVIFFHCGAHRFTGKERACKWWECCVHAWRCRRRCAAFSRGSCCQRRVLLACCFGFSRYTTGAAPHISLLFRFWTRCRHALCPSKQWRACTRTSYHAVLVSRPGRRRATRRAQPSC